MSIKFEKIISHARKNFKEQNTVSESSIIITDYFITIIFKHIAAKMYN